MDVTDSAGVSGPQPTPAGTRPSADSFALLSAFALWARKPRLVGEQLEALKLLRLIAAGRSGALSAATGRLPSPTLASA